MKLTTAEIDIYKRISYSDGISRKELAERSGLSQAAITKITKLLLANEYIVEGERFSSGLGRKEVMLNSNVEKFTWVGIDIGGYRVRLAVSDNRFGIIHRMEFFQSDCDSDDKMSFLIEQVRRLLAEAGVDSHAVNAIGVGVSGIVDAERETILNIPNASHWDQIHIVKGLREAFGCEVYLDEVGRAMALAEKYLGKARGVDDFLIVHIAYGVVAGIMMNGELLRGASNAGGLLGHITADPNGLRCTCGNYGCLENIVTYPMLADEYRERGGVASSFEDAYRLNEKIALDVCIDAGTALGIALSNTVNLFNPVAIYLGGPVFDPFPLLFEETKRTILLRANRFATVALNMDRSTFSDLQGIIGALILAKNSAIGG